MRRKLALATALFFVSVFVGSLVPTPPVAVDTQTYRLTQLQDARPYLETVSPNQLLSAGAQVSVSEADINARFTGMLLHLKWLIAREKSAGGVDKTLFDKQVESILDDINESNDDDDNDDLDEILDGGTFDNSVLTNPVFSGPIASNMALGPRYVSGDGDDEGILVDSDGNVQFSNGLLDTSGDVGTSGYILLSTGAGTNWVATSSLGLTASATPLTNDDVTPDFVASAGQTDEYCLTYEATGSTWEWQTCGSGGGFATSSIDTSAELAAIVGDETGSGALVFAGSPTLTGTLTATSANFSGNVGIGTTTPNQILTVQGNINLSATAGAIYFDDTKYLYASSTNDSIVFGEEAGALFGATSFRNIALGQNAMYGNVAGDDNVAIGASALFGNETGSTNVAIGSDALEQNWTGSRNIAVGGGAAAWNWNASSNIAIGYQALLFNESGSYNVAVGEGALSFDTATSNVAVGYQAGSSIFGGNNNIFLGYRAANNVTSGANNIVIGYDVDGISATASNRLNIGNLIFGTGLDGTGTTLATGNVGIGTTSPNAKLTVHGSINISDTTAGIQFSGTRYVHASTTNDSVAIGEFAGSSFTSNTTYNLAFGYEAGRQMSNTNADYMIMIGYQAGYQNTGDHTSIVGFGAGYQNSGDYTTIAGPSAGLANSGDYNTLFGAFAGRNNTGGFNNFIGHSVGFQNTGNYNNVVGYYAGYNNSGSYNDFMGYQAGRYLLSSSSVAIGGEALYGSHATNFYAANNVAIGYRAGYTADDGAANNILIGYQVADNITTGNNNIIIGFDINAISATADNRLNIGNLIFGTGLDGTGSTLASGNIGIGTTTPAQKLQVAGNIRVGTSGSNGCLENFGGGVIGGTCSSDEQLKDSIEPIAREGRSYIESIAALTAVSYNWNQNAAEMYSKDKDMTNIGLIAQDVEAQFPELVSLNDDGYRQIDFTSLQFYVIEALKELWAKVQGHDERLEDLERENDYLKERIETIEDELNIEPAPAPIPPPEPIQEISEPAVDENGVTEESPKSSEEANPVIEPEAPEPTYVLVPAVAPEEIPPSGE
ncbi:MAG: hypothetical protein RL538_872 [Candidatus Parcubacteria bacterium]|jgi:hypothetical protein